MKVVSSEKKQERSIVWFIQQSRFTLHAINVYTRPQRILYILCKKRSAKRARRSRIRARVTSVRGTHPVISSITFALFDAFGSMSPVPLLPADSPVTALMYRPTRFPPPPSSSPLILLPHSLSWLFCLLTITAIVLSSRDLRDRVHSYAYTPPIHAEPSLRLPVRSSNWKIARLNVSSMSVLSWI